MAALFARFFDNDDWRKPVLDTSTYPIPNGGRFARGDEYTQAWMKHPWLSTVFGYTEFEKNYDPEPVLNFMKSNNYVIPIVAVTLYIWFVFFQGPKIAGEKGKPLKWEFAFWNLGLSIFSFWGASRTVPHLFFRIFTRDFRDTVCESAHVAFGGGTAGLATQMFILSKIPELGDTVFLVLRKSKVQFLQWYHHITVLLYCWNSYVTEGGAGLYFVSMNYSVHAVMYFYFFLQAIKPSKAEIAEAGEKAATLTRVNSKGQLTREAEDALADKARKSAEAEQKSRFDWIPPKFVTAFQISQMVVGVIIVGSSIYYHYHSEGASNRKFHFDTHPGGFKSSPCNNMQSNLIAGFLMYASYLYLFVEFAVKKFLFGIDDYAPKKDGKKDGKKEN